MAAPFIFALIVQHKNGPTGGRRRLNITNDELKTCLDRIEDEILHDDYEEAFLVLNHQVSRAVMVGYKLAVTNFATWKDGQQLVGALERPLNKVFSQINRSVITIGKETTLELGN